MNNKTLITDLKKCHEDAMENNPKYRESYLAACSSDLVLARPKPAQDTCEHCGRKKLKPKKPKGGKRGRPKIRDDQLIRGLRKQGFTIRGIANLTGVSTTAVMRALK